MEEWREVLSPRIGLDEETWNGEEDEMSEQKQDQCLWGAKDDSLFFPRSQRTVGNLATEQLMRSVRLPFCIFYSFDDEK